jgi:hypothetical protein
MNTRLTLGAAAISTTLAALLAVPVARADDQNHRLGDHPAIVVQRLQKAAGYDYASKFYPHPAWLRLYAAQPRDDADGAMATAPSDPAPADRSLAQGHTGSAKPRSGG